MSKTTDRDHRQTSLENNRRDFLKQSATAAVGLGCLSLGLQTQPLLTAAARVASLPLQDRQGTHNMLVVGEQTAYLSHLPMFDGLNRRRTEYTSQHRYQVILEATFMDGPNSLTETYTADRRSHASEKMYSINPALFVLPDLDPKGKALRTFRGNTVYRGHLERESTPIIGHLDSQRQPPAGGAFDVNVTRVVHFHKFTPGAAKPAQLQYILFGKGAETFLAHFIAAPPDFDQVIGVKITGQQFTDEQLAGGIMVSFPGKANTSKTRLRETDKASGTFELAGTAPTPPATTTPSASPAPTPPGTITPSASPAPTPPAAATTPASSNAKTLEVEVIKEFYFEEGELRVPPTFEPTVEEKKSGFE